jgi:hypothetical protein
MAKPRPTEVKLVASLLDPDNATSEDAMDLATEIIEALDKSRAKRESYILVAQLAHWAPVQSFGEFSTKLQAEKFVKNLSAVDKDGVGKAVVCRLEEPDAFLTRMGEKK